MGEGGAGPSYQQRIDAFSTSGVRFRLKEGDTILAISGKGYKTKADVEKVIDAIKKDVPKAKVVEGK